MSDSTRAIQTEQGGSEDARMLAAAEYPPDYPFAPRLPPAGFLTGSKASKPGGPLHTQDWDATDGRIPLPLLALGLMSACGVSNLVLPPVIDALDEPSLVIGLTFAILLAQLAAVSLWTVWSERPLWFRLLAGALAAEGLLACFVLGLGFEAPSLSSFYEMARAVLCSLPLVMLSAQAPLWALRIYALWRIVPGDRPADNAPRPLSIGHILLATVIVALAVSLVRLAFADPQSADDVWLGWAIAVPAIAAVSLVSLPPAVYILLRGVQPVVGLIVLWGYATAAIVITLVLIAVVAGESIGGEEIAVVFCTVYGLASLLWVLLRAAYMRGYRLVMG